MIIVATGPTELHAHIDLDHRVRALAPPHAHPAVTVLATSEHQGSWSVVAELSLAGTDGGER